MSGLALGTGVGAAATCIGASTKVNNNAKNKGYLNFLETHTAGVTKNVTQSSVLVGEAEVLTIPTTLQPGGRRGDCGAFLKLGVFRSAQDAERYRES